MKKILIAAIICLLIPSLFESGAQASAESYFYESIPSGGGDTESVNISFSRKEEAWLYSSRSIKEDKIEEISIVTDPAGRFSSGISTTKDPSGNDLKTIRSWREGNRIHLENILERTAKIVTAPQGVEPALDGSLLLLLRPFLESKQPSADFFLLSFSGKSIKVKIHNAGVESISVPAGTFECYRVEIIVPVLFTKACVTAWLARDPPHYLIKQQGKRGPFSASYVTSLIRQAKG